MPASFSSRATSNDGKANHVYASIKDMVMKHDLPPGQRIRPEPLADRLFVSNTPVREALRRYEAGENPGEEANLAKLLAADASWAAAEACVQTHGGFGFAEEYDVERKFRETRLYRVAPISTNLILSYIAEHVLGLPRSY